MTRHDVKVEDPQSVTTKSTAIFGASDGIVAAIALILATGSRGPHVVLITLIGLLVAEGLGMAVSEFLSDPKMSIRQAVVMGISTSLAIIFPGIPWLVASGSSALLASGIVAVCVASVIAQIRPGGWQTWAQTFGVLSMVAAIAVGAGHL